MAEYPQCHREYIEGVSLLGKPLSGYLTFCDRLPDSTIANIECTSTILVSPELKEDLTRVFPSAKLIAVDDPRALFIDTLIFLQEAGIIGLTSLIPHSPETAADVVLGKNVVIESGVQIDGGVTIGSGSVLRRGTWLKKGVSIGENCVLGSVGINAYSGRDRKRRSFPHLAGTIIEEGVSVGASCVVVRGILGSTHIGANTIIGNLCNIGHGAELGENVWMSAGTLVGGHTKIEDRATIAIGCTIRDNIRVGAGANIGMGSVVTKNVKAGSSMFGNPAKLYRSIAAGPHR